jgi:nucleotide-binding universal stress UspA family protein
MKTCLIVGNRTLPGSELAAVLRDLVAGGDRTFYVVVPLAPIDHAGTWDEQESTEAARERLLAFVEHLRGHGVEADGEIGDRDPIQAIRDVMRARRIDEIVLSTLPAGFSRWLQADVPSRLQRSVEIPVTVVTQEAAVPASA